MSDRLSKENRKDLKRPDAFVAWGRKEFELLGGHSKAATIVVAATLVIVFGWYGYTQWTEHRSEKAWEAFFEANKKDDAARWTALEGVANERSGTRAGAYAAVVLGDHYLQSARTKIEKQLGTSVPSDKDKGAKKAKGDPAFRVRLSELPTETEESKKAGDWYAKAAAYGALTGDEKQLLSLNVANALEIGGAVKEAEQKYKQASTMGETAKGLALLGLGRVLEIQGQKDQAVKVYEDMVKEFGGSEKNREYERLAQGALRRLQSKLLSEGN